MYSRKHNLLIGFHGCDKDVAMSIVTHKEPMKFSMNDYDWLGHGMYFWEDNYERAYQWAIETSKRTNSRIKTPYVLGAVIDLGYCLDLVQSRYLLELQEAFWRFSELYKMKNWPLPKNHLGTDHLKRCLDCSVIESLHDMRETMGLSSYDSIRGVFWEGKELYPGAGFKEKNHIQICVRNADSIKGFFIPGGNAVQ